MKSIDKLFNFLIKGKLRDLIITVLDEEETNYNIIFQNLDNIFIYNNKTYLDLKFFVETLQINYLFHWEYFFYLL